MLLSTLLWQAAGKDHQTGEKSLMIRLLRKSTWILSSIHERLQHKKHMTLFQNLPKNEKENLSLVNSLRHYDHTVNVKWVMEHYKTARHYLESGKKKEEATGGSDWKKYMHPKYQRRVFFPKLWTNDEMKNWGEQNLDGHEILTNFAQIEI